MADTQSLVGRLASGEVILGDGSYIMTLEKRGYATAGSWTPEAAAEHPEAIEQCAEINQAAAAAAQPLGYRVPDGGSFGWVEIPEFPFSVEPRQITRWEARRWARQAYELGVRFIGGCCGFEPYHIRAMAEELADIRGGLPVASNKSDHDLAIHRSLEEKGLKRYKNKGCLDYWMEHQPATGRPLSTAVCCPLAEPAVMHPGVFS